MSRLTTMQSPKKIRIHLTDVSPMDQPTSTFGPFGEQWGGATTFNVNLKSVINVVNVSKIVTNKMITADMGLHLWKDQLESFKSNLPLGEYPTTTESCTNAILFLLSDLASYKTGTVLLKWSTVERLSSNLHDDDEPNLRKHQEWLLQYSRQCFFFYQMDTEKTELEKVGVQELEKNQNVEATVIAVEDEDNNDVEPRSHISIDLGPVQSSQSNASMTKFDMVCDSNKDEGKHFYTGDVVVLKDDQPSKEWTPMFGTVTTAPKGTESKSEEDGDGSTKEFHVHWDMTNRISVTDGSQVALVDRTLFRGQKVLNADGVTGIVTSSERTATVQISGTDNIVDNVPVLRLEPLSEYVRGQEILYKDWVGVITGVGRNVWFKADRGPRFYLEAFETDGFARADPFWGIGVACPGQRTRIASSILKRAKYFGALSNFFSKFLPLRYIYSFTSSTIIRTEVVSLQVKWLQLNPSLGLNTETDETLEPPPEVISKDELANVIAIGVPSSETIGIGSVRKLQVLPGDDVAKSEAWLDGFKKFIHGGSSWKCMTSTVKYQKATTLPSPLSAVLTAHEAESIPVKVLHRQNKITVEWEDGTVENVFSTDIPRVAPLFDDGEFPTGLTVSRLEKDATMSTTYGIVMDSSELAKARTRKINVRWIVDGIDTGVQKESVFEIKPHREYSLYHRWTIVFPRGSSPQSFKSAVVVDINISGGKMVIVRAEDGQQQEVYPHEVIGLAKRCHWSFFSRQWNVDEMIPPPYQLQLEYDPVHNIVDVNEQNLGVLMKEDPNNPIGDEMLTTLWDEPTFEILGFAPKTHRYYDVSFPNGFGPQFAQSTMKEWEFFQKPENITEGIWLRCYENRMDLLSVLMVGPTKTPYEDGLLVFDMQLLPDFPASRPSIHFVSYTLEIHPLLSYDGNVCSSMVPWEFPDNVESPASYIMYYLSELQELLFTPTPYFASPLKKSEEGTDFGRLKSELYNQGVFVRVLDSIWNMLQRPHAPWEKCIQNHFASALPEKLMTMEKWMSGNQSDPSEYDGNEDSPTIPQMQIPDGLRVSLNKRLAKFHKLVKGSQIAIVEIQSVKDATADSESSSIEPNPVESSANFPIITTTDSGRRLTPISELTENSSTSTFGNKISNVSVSPNPEEADDLDDKSDTNSLDSLENVKTKTQKGIVKAEMEENQNSVIEYDGESIIESN